MLHFFFLETVRMFSFSIFYWKIFSLALSFCPMEAISLLSSLGCCVCVGVWLFVPCRCCLCCVGPVTCFPLFPKQAATVEVADSRPWKMASIIWEPVCGWQFGKLDSSGHQNKSLWGTKDVLLHTFSWLQQLLGDLSPSIARVEIHTVFKI